MAPGHNCSVPLAIPINIVTTCDVVAIISIVVGGDVGIEVFVADTSGGGRVMGGFAVPGRGGVSNEGVVTALPVIRILATKSVVQ